MQAPSAQEEPPLLRQKREKKKESTSPLRELGSVLPAGNTSLAGAQLLPRNRKRAWTDQASSEPIPLMLFSKTTSMVQIISLLSS